MAPHLSPGATWRDSTAGGFPISRVWDTIPRSHSASPVSQADHILYLRFGHQIPHLRESNFSSQCPDRHPTPTGAVQISKKEKKSHPWARAATQCRTVALPPTLPTWNAPPPRSRIVAATPSLSRHYLLFKPTFSPRHGKPMASLAGAEVRCLPSPLRARRRLRRRPPWCCGSHRLNHWRWTSRRGSFASLVPPLPTSTCWRRWFIDGDRECHCWAAAEEALVT